MKLDEIGKIISGANTESEHAAGQLVGVAIALALPLNTNCQSRFDYLNYINLQTDALSMISAINEVAILDIDEAKHMLEIVYAARCELATGCLGENAKWLATPLLTDAETSRTVAAIVAAIKS